VFLVGARWEWERRRSVGLGALTERDRQRTGLLFLLPEGGGKLCPLFSRSHGADQALHIAAEQIKERAGSLRKPNQTLTFGGVHGLKTLFSMHTSARDKEESQNHDACEQFFSVFFPELPTPLYAITLTLQGMCLSIGQDITNLKEDYLTLRSLQLMNILSSRANIQNPPLFVRTPTFVLLGTGNWSGVSQS
jgi:hypothetical protein